ncbi:hypothetical protein Ahy_A06g027321 [Arachis hypogaea]|uniref:Aminotransferase-like plant mobile domain-containing protein n=1 Tax=Arachis hypogaea TaxID=3818 RepID=A0A445CN80_ARAHY|nr:hypothetical protein Ahy_A06g027321 [Arachis hypogaea]
MLATLVERWRPETHTFVLSIGEVTVTLEDVAHIFGLPIDGEAISGWTDSSGEFVQSQGIAIFGREPSVSGNAKSYVKLGWVRRIRDAELLDTDESIRRYVRCHIFCLLGSTLFTDKSTAYAHVIVVLLSVSGDTQLLTRSTLVHLHQLRQAGRPLRQRLAGRPLRQMQVGQSLLQRLAVRELWGWMTQFEVTHMTYGRSEIYLIGYSIAVRDGHYA